MGSLHLMSFPSSLPPKNKQTKELIKPRWKCYILVCVTVEVLEACFKGDKSDVL